MPTQEQLLDRPFFNADRLPELSYEYVGWFDVLGTQAHLTQFHKRAANFFAKIHLAAIRARRDPLRLYPVMDGVYVTSTDRNPMLDFVHDFFRLLTIVFCGEARQEHRFIVRGAMAYGPVTHGADLSDRCAQFGNDAYRDSLLIGMPMIQAYQAESSAPPFGVFLHESTRSFSSPGVQPLTGRWLRWWRDEDQPLVAEMREAINQYFRWAGTHVREVDYPLNRLPEHEGAAREYFEVDAGPAELGEPGREGGRG